MRGKRETGGAGEKIAAAYLKRTGYRILDRNWSVRGGGGKMMSELDIVARKGEDIIFVEVKAGAHGERDSSRTGWRPEVHVTPRKAERLRRGARAWLARHGLLGSPWQIDVIAVDFPDVSEGGLPRIRHIRHAVTEEQ